MTAPKALILSAKSATVLTDAIQVILEALPSRLDICRVVMEERPRGAESGTHFYRLPASRPQLVILVLPASELGHANKLLERLKADLAGTPLMLATEAVAVERINPLLKMGVNDFVVTPFNRADLCSRVRLLLEQCSAGAGSSREIKEHLQLQQLIGKNEDFVAEINKIPTVAKYDSSVLILGETGTGKEVCARAIHYLSPRADKPFIPVNCAAIPLELIENELFGHERGAYTNAYTSQPGLIREADGGTILLDEIDSLPLLAQVKLLRFIQDKEYRPLGAVKSCHADVRVIAATNARIDKAISEGRFRQDLYYRVNVVQLKLPPLRERKGDIPLLARHFLQRLAVRFNKQVEDFSADALKKLMSYDWPGNVRELEHIIERAIILSGQKVITAADLHLDSHPADAALCPFSEAKRRAIYEFERSYLEIVLVNNQGNITQAAQAARKNRRAFFELIRKHHIDVQSLKGARKDSGS